MIFCSDFFKSGCKTQRFQEKMGTKVILRNGTMIFFLVLETLAIMLAGITENELHRTLSAYRETRIAPSVMGHLDAVFRKLDIVGPDQGVGAGTGIDGKQIGSKCLRIQGAGRIKSIYWAGMDSMNFSHRLTQPE